MPEMGTSNSQNKDPTAPTQERQTNESNKKNAVYIVGDSIIQHVQGRLFRSTDRYVAVKSFSGARVEDMEDFLKPFMRREPEEILLHVGTNNIRDETPPVKWLKVS